MNKIIIPEIDIKEYDYTLPKDKIALFPLEKRDESKLLFSNVETGSIKHLKFRDIPGIIERGSLLIINETKVIGARLNFRKGTGGAVELLLVEPKSPSIIPAITLSEKGSCSWECIIGGRKVTEGTMLFHSSDLSINARVVSRESNRGVIEFTWQEDLPFSMIIDRIGDTPLPPYINRETNSEDIQRYQTVFANDEGSVAAPTAGLHFTDSILGEMSNSIDIARITLHVGPGTFQPVEGEIAVHDMHSEQVYINKVVVEKILAAIINKKRITAVGTTCCRTIESLYWYGVRILEGGAANQLDVGQWEPYQSKHNYSAQESLNAVLDKMSSDNEDFIFGRTKLIIVPGYKFRITSGLITNFHLPKSTLILLVAAFTGKRLWQKIYETAKENEYRFLSYGDSTYLIKSVT